MPLRNSDSQTKELKEKLVEEALRAEERGARLLADRTGNEYANLSIISPQTQALELITEDEARSAFCAPFTLKQKALSFACKDPELATTKVVMEKLKAQGYQLKVYVVSSESLKYVWQDYGLIDARHKKEITGKIDVESQQLADAQKNIKSIGQVREQISLFNKPYASQILEIILAGALALDASDVHVEAEEGVGRLRYRIDGALQDIADLPLNYYRSILSRIKLLGGMKINIHSTAQDGRFTIKAAEVAIEIRVSIIPSAYGETVVMRILNPKTIQSNLEDLGFREDDLAIIDEQIKRPNGIILNTGPTGSGKTTTLYAFLRKIYDPEMKIITIEDPIEYHLDGVTQTQVNVGKDYTFANGLRSILRQDPDVILVGEIRDNETAGIAMHAALTGHLVFSTLHTNEAAGTIPRLLDMGVQPAILAPALNLAIAQRLVRKLCVACRKKAKLTPKEAENARKIVSQLPSRVKKPELSQEIEVFEAGSGCDKCNGTGYKGRIAVLELLVVDPEIQQIINQPRLPTILQLKEAAVKKGMLTMEGDAVLKILAGLTSIDEAESVLGKII
ncbi:MAG: GspE/PulE family protein [bacterium]|nr:GspE/PulE family protein [bacterium]